MRHLLDESHLCRGKKKAAFMMQAFKVAKVYS